jgi:hypothetical protein
MIICEFIACSIGLDAACTFYNIAHEFVQHHHIRCPWTGTGIGHGNMLAFKVFVVGVNILCYASIILVVWSLLDGLVA